MEFANELHQEFGSLYGFHILAPFPGTEVREKAADYGLEILTSDWTRYDANHVVTRTPGYEKFPRFGTNRPIALITSASLSHRSATPG